MNADQIDHAQHPRIRNPGTDAQHARDLRKQIAAFEKPSLSASLGQLATSLGLFLIVCAGMYWSLGVSYFLTLALAVPAAGFLVRLFIVQHDCGHGAFFRRRWANDLVGTIASAFTFAPYLHWRSQHAGHHRHWNNLDRRESGADIYSTCLTVYEYRATRPWDRWIYRAIRHPIIAHVILPPVVFILLYRVPFDTPRKKVRERRSVWATNAMIAAIIAGLCLLLGPRNVALVQLPIMILASIIGVWLFALQHRFEGVKWARQGEWNVVDAALGGSSYLKLSRVLQWFTGNIGFHHIHHLSSRIPNYRLETCHRSIPAMRGVRTLTWRDGLAATRLAIWDEEANRMVRFAEIAAYPA